MTERILPPYTAAPPHGPAAEKLARIVADALPPTLIRLWAESERGTMIVTDDEPHLEEGLVHWRDIRTDGALYLPPDCSPQPLWATIGKWLDRFSGSFAEGGCISHGYGATPALEEAAVRLQETLELGYANDYLGSEDASVLFANSIAAYLLDQRSLSAVDPLLARWLRGTLFNEGLWRKVSQERKKTPGQST